MEWVEAVYEYEILLRLCLYMEWGEPEFEFGMGYVRTNMEWGEAVFEYGMGSGSVQVWYGERHSRK